MSSPILQLEQPPAACEDAMPPEIVQIIEALAEAQARKDYAARYPTSELAAT